MNIILGSIVHESGTFNPNRTGIESFKRTQYLFGEEVLAYHRGKPTELGGMLQALEAGSVTPLPVLSAVAMCSGVVRKRTYQVLKARLLDGVRRHLPVADGVLLCLHGSMTVDQLEDPEGDLLAAIRTLLPAGKYLAASLDHHANVTSLMVESADILIGYRTHPHTDQHEVGAMTARALLDLIAHRYTLTKSFFKLPLMTPAENRSEAILALAKETRTIEEDPGVLTASFFVGYPWADLSIQGASTLVITRNNALLAERLAGQLATLMWDLRRDFKFPIYSVEEAIEKGNAVATRPFVLDELPDCTLGGAAGDVVTTARYLVEHHVPDSVVLGIVDAKAVSKATAAGVGATLTLSIGGHSTREGNPPMRITCSVKRLAENIVDEGNTHPGFETRLGKIAVVEANGVDIVLLEFAGKIEGPSFMSKLGIEARQKKFIVSKEGLNVFLTYKAVGAEILMVESAGFNRQSLRPSDYKRVPRPIYPLDPDIGWSVELPH
jgi:microcystin degradation protein MlrC